MARLCIACAASVCAVCSAGCGSDAELAVPGEGNASEGGAGSMSAAGAGGSAPASDVISVDEGAFQLGDAPAETAPGGLPSIVSLTGPVAVTNGGSATLHVQLSAPLAAPQFLVSLSGDSGYHSVPGTDLDADGVYDISVQVSGEANARSLVLRVALTDGMGSVGPYSELEVEVVQSGRGDVKITLSFDRTHDLDLRVLEPNGEEVSWENADTATGGKLDLDSGQHCEASPANAENIFWPPGGAPSGEYRVIVQNYEHCTPGELPFSVRIAYDTTVTLHRGSFADGTEGNLLTVATFSR